MRSRLAVDFGTSHTVAVVQRQDEPPRSLLFDGSPILPSAVCLGDDGVLHVGRDAQRMALVGPTRFEPHPKRRIDDGKVLLGDTEVPVVDLFAGVLRRVAEEARQAGLADPAAAGCTVLTCPADWGAARRVLVTQAALLAGLGEVRLVDEPVAAATYCLAVEKEQVADGQPLVVFDFGGGTFDVALIRREGDSWRLLATGGLDDLGGVDVDAALVGHLGQLLELKDPDAWRRLDNPTTPPELRDRRAFWTEVRTAKEMLSRVTTAPVQVPRTDDTLHLTREELERVAGPLVARAVDETRRVLQRAGVSPAALAGIFLVGGSSRLPLVATRLHARFGVAPRVPEQPELPVAHGALLATATATPVIAPDAPSQTDAWPAPASTGTFTAAPQFAPPQTAAPQPPAPQPAPVSAAPVSPSPTSGPPVSGPPVSAVPGASSPVSTAPVSPVPMPPPALTPPALIPPSNYTPPVRPRGSDTPSRAPLILGIVAVAIVVLVAAGGIGIFNGIRNFLQGVEGASNQPGGLSDRLNGDGVKTTGKLTTVKKATVPADASAVAGAAAPTVGYYAVSAGNKTQVTGQPTGDGEPWTVDLVMYPDELDLVVVGDLLVVDGSKSVKHGGNDARAVIDTRSHRKLWEKAWGDGWDVGYVGTDVIVEYADGFKLSLARIDLRTGATKWSRKGPENSQMIVGRHRGQLALSWPTAKNPATPIAIPGDHVGSRGGDDLRPHLHSGTDIVEVCECGEVAVLDSNTGKPRTQRKGLARFDMITWTVYEGLLIGITDQNSQKILVAYRLSDLGEAWRYPAPPGTSTLTVTPCGPKLLCTVRSVNSKTSLLAINTATGRDAWQLTDDVPTSWFAVIPMANGLLVGEKPFNFLRTATFVDHTGKPKKRFGDSSMMIALHGKRVVFLASKSGGWNVFVGTVDSDKRSPAVSTTEREGLPDAISLAGDTVVVTADDDDKSFYVLKASGLPAP